MKITFENNINDSIALNDYVEKTSSFQKKNNIFIRFSVPIILIIAIISVLIVANWSLESSVVKIKIFLYSSFAIVWVLSIINIKKSLIKRNIKRLYFNKDSYEVTIETSNTNLIFSEIRGSSTIKASCLNKIVITNDYFFIFTDIINAIVIPKTILDKQGCKDELIKFFTDNKCSIENYL